MPGPDGRSEFMLEPDGRFAFWRDQMAGSNSCQIQMAGSHFGGTRWQVRICWDQMAGSHLLGSDGRFALLDPDGRSEFLLVPEDQCAFCGLLSL